MLGPLLTGRSAEGGHRRELLDRLHAATGVRTRHLALPLDEYAGLTSFGLANEVYLREGTTLAAQASAAALARAGIRPDQVDFLLFTSVTGVSVPSVDALLVERLGLRSDVRRMPSFGLGCAGGAAGLARLHDYLVGHPHDVGLLVCLELCSLTIQHGDDSTANLVSSGLFGDGAAAAVLVGEAYPAGAGSLRVIDSASHLHPGTQDQLGWRVTDTGFRVVLAAGLPDLIEESLADDVRALLEPHDLKPRDVRTWVVHAGGPRILTAVQRALDLDAEDLAPSRASLEQAGNLSSASVLHVLALTLDRPGPPEGFPGVLMAFGPGVSTDLVLLRWPGAA